MSATVENSPEDEEPANVPPHVAVVDSKPVAPRCSWLSRVRQSRATILFVVSLSLFADVLIYGVSLPILPDYAGNKVGMSQALVGLLFSTYGVGVILSTPVIGKFTDTKG